MDDRSSKNKTSLLLLLILVFALALRLIFFTGVSSSDSLYYSEFADKIIKNQPFIGNHLSLRLGIIYPAAMMYSLFGVNDYSSGIMALVFSLASIILIYKFGRLLFSEKAGLLSAFLMSFFPLDVILSTTLMGDITSTFFLALSVYLFLKSEKTDNKKNSGWLCLISGVSLGAAYLIREISVLIALFFVVYVIYKKKIKSNYFLVPLGFLLVSVIEVVYFYNATGNPFFRFSTVNSEWATIILNAPLYSRGAFPYSLLYFPYIIFTHHFLGLFYPFILVSVFYFIVYKKKDTYSMLFWFVPLLVYICIGSTSPTRYVLFPADPRMLSLITFPGILLLAQFLSQQDRIIKKALAPSISVLLLLTSIGLVAVSDYRHTLDIEKNIYSSLKALPSKQVYTDESTVRVMNYLSSYRNTDNFKEFNHYDFLNSKNNYALDLSRVKDAYIVVNRESADYNLARKTGIVYPKDIFDIPKNWILKKELSTKTYGKVEIYYAS